MAQAVVHRAAGDERLTPQVRKVLLALIVGGIAAILDSTMVTMALHTLVVSLHSTTARSSGSRPATCWRWRSRFRSPDGRRAGGAAGASGWPRWCSSSPDRSCARWPGVTPA